MSPRISNQAFVRRDLVCGRFFSPLKAFWLDKEVRLSTVDVHFIVFFLMVEDAQTLNLIRVELEKYAQRNVDHVYLCM